MEPHACLGSEINKKAYEYFWSNEVSFFYLVVRLTYETFS